MKPNNPLLFLSLFLLSACILTLEVAQMKLFAFSLQFFVIHIVLGIVLMGFGISGTIFSISRRLKSSENLVRVAGLAYFGFPTTVLLTTLYFCWIAPQIDVFETYGFSNLIALVSLMTIPYIFAGLALAVVFTLTIERIGLTYFFNLVGSALGCLIVFPLLTNFGMAALLFIVCATAFASFVMFRMAYRDAIFSEGGPQAKWFTAVGVALTALLVLLLPVANRMYDFPPDANDQFSIIKRELEKREGATIEPELRFAKWDPAGKIEVYDFPGTHLAMPDPIPMLWYCQDSGAGSILFDFGPNLERGGPFFEQTIYGMPYAIANEQPKVLAIGLGGGIDIQTALHYGASEVTGIELSAAAVEAVAGSFDEFVGGIYNRPNVDVHALDGRTFIWKNEDKFDLIQITGADTKQFWASNAMALNINYLYTVESFNDYLDSLDEGGILSITRFTYDLMRLTTIAVETLDRRGVEQPEKNIVIVYQGVWGNILIKNEAFTAEELAKIRAKVEAHKDAPEQWVNLSWFDVMGFGFDKPFIIEYAPDTIDLPNDDEVPYFDRALLQAVAEGRMTEYLDAHNNNYYPTTDDNPFFFRQMRFSAILSKEGLYVKIYMIFICIVLAIAAIFCLYPLYRFKRRHLKTQGAPWLLLFFFCIGVGFMYLEIGLMQRLGRFLGNPGYSVSVILFALLLFSGLGSYLSGRFDDKWRVIRTAGVLLAVYMMSLNFAMRPILNSFITTSLTPRALVVIALLAPLGVCMGMMFPSGLSLLQGQGRKFIPWAVGVNGFASVLGSLTYILFVMAFGFKVSLMIGVALYLGALGSMGMFVAKTK